MTPAAQKALETITWPVATVAPCEDGYVASVTWDGRTVRSRTTAASETEALAWAEKERDDLHRLYGPLVLSQDELAQTMSLANRMAEEKGKIERNLLRETSFGCHA